MQTLQENTVICSETEVGNGVALPPPLQKM